MASHARFLFEQDFAAPIAEPEPEVPAIPTIELPAHEAALAVACEEGRTHGYEEGKQDAEAQAARELTKETGRLTQEARRLATAAQSILAALDADRERVERLAIELALSSSKRLCRNLIDQQPEEEILALLRDCLSPLRNAPHLVVRLNPAVASKLEESITKLARQQGFDGRLVLLAEDDVGAGDCRIEWADGGITRSFETIEADIDRLVSAYIASHFSADVTDTDIESGPEGLDPPQASEQKRTTS